MNWTNELDATLTNELLDELIRTAPTTYRPDFRGVANQRPTVVLIDAFLAF